MINLASPLVTYCNFLIWDQLFLILSTFHFAQLLLKTVWVLLSDHKETILYV